MRRRDFLALAGVAVAFPRVALAQQVAPPRGPGERPWLIGAMVNSSKIQSDIDTLGPFLKGMAALGYFEGRDFKVEARYTNGDLMRNDPVAQELVALRPDLILTSNEAQAISVAAVTKTTPIVAYIALESAAAQLIGTSARPAGNVTGIINDSGSVTGKHCDLALELVPATSRIGALALANSERGTATRNAVNAAAAARKFTPVIVDVALADINAGFKTLAQQRADIAIVGAGLNIDRAFVVQSAAAVGLPTIYNEQTYVELGGLISYGFDRKATFTRLASVVDELLRGKRVANLPAEAVSTWITAINLKTAKNLGLMIPPGVMFRADLVIE